MTHCLEIEGYIIVHTDTDGQYPAKYIPLLIEKVLEGYDLVIGNRFLNGINYRNSKFKAMGNILFSKFISTISGKKVTDTTSGFRAMNRKVATNIKIRSTFTYTYDQYLQAIHNQYSILEVPIDGSKTRKSRLMKNIFHYILRVLWDILVCFRRR